MRKMVYGFFTLMKVQKTTILTTLIMYNIYRHDPKAGAETAYILWNLLVLFINFDNKEIVWLSYFKHIDIPREVEYMSRTIKIICRCKSTERRDPFNNVFNSSPNAYRWEGNLFFCRLALSFSFWRIEFSPSIWCFFDFSHTQP